MANRPFESRIQDLVYNVDAGVGLRLIKFGLYVLFLIVVMVVYSASEFRGLRDAEAMDYAQLGRNFMLTKTMTTHVVRPSSLWYMIEKSGRADANPKVMEHPDIVHPPVYPMALATGFKVFRSVAFTPVEAGKPWRPEQWVIMPMGHVCTVLTGLLLYLTGRRLFDSRVALLAVTLFFLSNAVWKISISGLPIAMATLFTTFAIYAALTAMGRRDEGRASATWFIPLTLSAVSCGLAFLTRYGTIALLPALLLFVGFSCREKGWRWGSYYLLVVLVVISPWILRNISVCGSPLGLAPYLVLNGDDPVADNVFERTLAPALDSGVVTHALLVKLVAGLGKLYETNLRTLGDGILIGFFVVTFFYSFARENVRRLRWCIVPSIALLCVLAALFGQVTARLLHIFVPVLIVYASAFFFILLDRLQHRLPVMRLGVILGFVGLGAMPLVFTLLPPAATPPYPPYYPPFISRVSSMLTEDELMCTDMPWATAWYGNRKSLLLPTTIDDYYEINDYTHRISGLYFTTITRDREFVKTLQAGVYRTWYPLLIENHEFGLKARLPGDFPLQNYFPLNNLDQMFLSDRDRWRD